jgi:hypothetical protein
MTKEIHRLDYVREGTRYTIHVKEADNGVRWGTWNCHECNTGGSSNKQASDIDSAVEAAKSDLEKHHIMHHKV